MMLCSLTTLGQLYINALCTLRAMQHTTVYRLQQQLMMHELGKCRNRAYLWMVSWYKVSLGELWSFTRHMCSSVYFNFVHKVSERQASTVEWLNNTAVCHYHPLHHVYWMHCMSERSAYWVVAVTPSLARPEMMCVCVRSGVAAECSLLYGPAALCLGICCRCLFEESCGLLTLLLHDLCNGQMGQQKRAQTVADQLRLSHESWPADWCNSTQLLVPTPLPKFEGSGSDWPEKGVSQRAPSWSATIWALIWRRCWHQQFCDVAFMLT